MMAAAAAAASAISRQSAAAATAASSAANNQPGSASNLQQETTRSASRLSSASTSTTSDGDENEAPAAAVAVAASNLPNNNGSNNNTGILYNIKQRLPRRLARLISYTNLQEQSNQLQAATSRRRQPAATTTQPFEQPIPPPALAALLHHYSALLPPGHPANFLFPPLAHLGAPGFAFSTPGDTFNLRPPPPSYNASMQDTRLRMLMQERAHLNNIMHPTSNQAPSALQQPSSPPPPARPRPPPPPPPPSELTTAEADDSNSSLDLTTPSDRLSDQEQRQQVANATLDHQIRPSSSHQSSNLETSPHPPLVASTSRSNGRLDVMKYEQRKQQNQHKEQLRMSRNNKTSVPTRLKSSPSISVPTLVNNDIYVSSSSSPCLAARDKCRDRDVHEDRQAGASTIQANNWIRNSTVVSIGSGANNGSSCSTNTSEERHVNKSGNKNENKSENKNENENENENNCSMNENQRDEVKILGYL